MSECYILRVSNVRQVRLGSQLKVTKNKVYFLISPTFWRTIDKHFLDNSNPCFLTSKETKIGTKNQLVREMGDKITVFD